MKNVAIIGQSPAVHAAVKALLERDPSLGITVISCDGQRPYDRMLLPGLIDRSVKEKDIFCAPVDYYTSAQVQLVLDKEIQRVNFVRHRVFCADKAQVDFDGLIIADAPHLRLPQFKGIRRQGVFNLARFASVKALIAYLAFTETVVIEPLGFAGIRAALALKAVGKEVLVSVRDEGLLTGLIPPERATALSKALEQRGVRVIVSSGGITDIIGENEVKAVRLKSGKVVACDMVVLEDVAPDMRFVGETELAVMDRIPVTDALLSNMPGVYAMDITAQIDMFQYSGQNWLDTDTGSAQASVAAANMLGEEKKLMASDLASRDILETFFHPQELVITSSEMVA